MFTGLIEETGTIRRIQTTGNGRRLVIEAQIAGHGLQRGDSLAVNGCCLTVANLARSGRKFVIEMDLLEETWVRTNLQFAQAGSLVNLERALPAQGRLGGHFVTGHIDALGKITRWERQGADWLLEVAPPAPWLRYVVEKGSVAVDGISLTVAGVTSRRFQVWIVPHTYRATALRERKRGDYVNLEADMLAKYVEKLIGAQ